jgi:hypothetical protein
MSANYRNHRRPGKKIEKFKLDYRLAKRVFSLYCLTANFFSTEVCKMCRILCNGRCTNKVIPSFHPVPLSFFCELLCYFFNDALSVKGKIPEIMMSYKKDKIDAPYSTVQVMLVS